MASTRRKKRIKRLRKLPTTIRNSTATIPSSMELSVPSEVRMAQNEQNKDSKKVAIKAFTGQPVSLAGYPYYIDDPVVYVTNGIEFPKEKIPYLLDHVTPIGYANNVQRDDASIDMDGYHVYPNDESAEVLEAINQEVPYEASLRLKIKPDDVTFVTEGSVVVNGLTLTAPLYIVNKSTAREVSATLFGRDGNTSISNSDKEEFMAIKNGFSTIKNSQGKSKGKETPTPPSGETQNKEGGENKGGEEGGKGDGKGTPSSPPNTVQNNEGGNGGGTPTPPVTQQTSTPTNGGVPDSISNALDWMVEYPKHLGLVRDAVKNGWSKEELDREVKADLLNNDFRGAPGVHTPSPIENALDARLALAMQVSPETISKKVGEKATDHALSQGPLGLREMVMYVANATGGRFNGHSDVDAMCKHVREGVVLNSQAYSHINLPNLMKRVADWRLEDMWGIGEPFAPKLLAENSNKDFKPTGHIRPSGGGMWNGLNKEGKIDHGSMGEEAKYQTHLSTVAQMLVFKREDIINDDIGWVNEVLDMMIEGAMMVPDYQLVNLIYNAVPSKAGFLTEGGTRPSYYRLKLSKENLSTVYQAVRRRNAQKEEKVVKARFNTRWALVVTADLEETAWEIIKQDRLVTRTSPNDGERNYWFNRLDIETFDNLDNDTYHPDAAANTWGIMPATKRYAPFSITYLNNQRRPVTETVTLPADMLGFGVRGWWDLGLDYREAEATAWSFPSQATSSSPS